MRIMWSILAAALLPALPSMADPIEISEALANIEGTEVRVSGQFGKFRDGYMIRSDVGSFNVELALNRDALADIRDCTLNILPSETDCAADMLAELRPDGGEIILVAYEVIKR